MSSLPASTRDLAAVRRAIRGELELPAIPRVVRTLIAQLKSPTVDLHALVSELEQEPLLAARTLRLANSPFYSGPRSLASIADAVVVVGTSTLRTLVIAGGLNAVFVDVPGVNLRQFWIDASIAARASRLLARAAALDGEAAYLAGLLHACGHLILCQAYPERMGAVVSRGPTRSGVDLAHAERSACGLSYPEVGAAWIDGLGFPEPIVEAVAYQLLPGDGVHRLAAVVHIAAGLCRSIEGGLDAAQAVQAIDDGVAGLLGGPSQPWMQALLQSYDTLAQEGGAA